MGRRIRPNPSSVLGHLARLLRDGNWENRGLVELQALNQLVSDLNRPQKGKICKISLKEMIFHVSHSRMKPKPSIPIDEDLDITLEMDYILLEDGSIKEDDINDYNMNILLTAKQKEGDKQNKFAWHLDCEPYTKASFLHPHFHFHAGGHKIEDAETGELLMLTSPRIAYPPMDVVLAINFVLMNFFNREVYADIFKALGKGDYRNIMAESVEKIIKPYYEKIQQALLSNKDCSYFPLYI